jgi:hypothetical protein
MKAVIKFLINLHAHWKKEPVRREEPPVAIRAVKSQQLELPLGFDK